MKCTRVLLFWKSIFSLSCLERRLKVFVIDFLKNSDIRVSSGGSQLTNVNGKFILEMSFDDLMLILMSLEMKVGANTDDLWSHCCGISKKDANTFRRLLLIHRQKPIHFACSMLGVGSIELF